MKFYGNNRIPGNIDDFNIETLYLEFAWGQVTKLK